MCAGDSGTCKECGIIADSLTFLVRAREHQVQFSLPVSYRRTHTAAAVLLLAMSSSNVLQYSQLYLVIRISTGWPVALMNRRGSYSSEQWILQQCCVLKYIYTGDCVTVFVRIWIFSNTLAIFHFLHFVKQRRGQWKNPEWNSQSNS